ncbi:hypothetical protein [Novacetimonas pomaceti]|uniref:hypothetical protein n=1 Tax=Novacetimonas pomaceti TaxID=2021998 RepID=UPI001C2CCACA|nr:hypothetical protein [Novacetimonas pomaceti]MBV1834049.1 hypothetical protein [Novacetimonas pomaceti]
MMRPTAPLLLLLTLTGCGGFGKVLADNTELPGSLPNMPKMEVDSENLRRSMGHAAAEPPILPQGHNIWPTGMQEMPTLADISSGRVHAVSGHFMRRSADDSQQLPDGGSLSIGDSDDPSGELAAPETGIPAKQDQGHTVAANSDIIVPHADGSKTVIGADGTVVERQHP